MKQFMCGWENVFGEIIDHHFVDNFMCREQASLRGFNNLRRLKGRVIDKIAGCLDDYEFRNFNFDRCQAAYLESIFDRIHFTCYTYSPTATEDFNEFSMQLIQDRYPSISIKPDSLKTPFGKESVGAVLEGGVEVLHAFYWYQLFLRAPWSETLDDVFKWVDDIQYRTAWEVTPTQPIEWAYCIVLNRGPLRFLNNRSRVIEPLNIEHYLVYEGAMLELLGARNNV